MAQTLESLIEKEHETVQKEREDLLAKRAEIDEQLRALDLRLDAATNYKATLEGKFARPTQGQRKSRAPSTERAPRAKQGELPELWKRIAGVVEQYGSDGARADTIYDEMRSLYGTDKKPIDAALLKMKQRQILTQTARKQPYKLGSAWRQQPAAPEPAPAEEPVQAEARA
jgi:Skp family chaperone for outer membrane proteins